MSLFNYNAKEIHCKVVYYGIKGAGKTSNIKWLSQNTKDQQTDSFSIPIKTKPSTFFDFLPLEVGTIRGFKTCFHLYTIPGGDLFESSQKLLLKGVDGIVFVADSQKEKMQSNLEAFNTLKELLDAEGMNLEKIPMVLQYNKRDLDDVCSINEMRTVLNCYNNPDFSCTATDGKGVFEALKALLKLVLALLKGGNFQ